MGPKAGRLLGGQLHGRQQTQESPASRCLRSLIFSTAVSTGLFPGGCRTPGEHVACFPPFDYRGNRSSLRVRRPVSPAQLWTARPLPVFLELFLRLSNGKPSTTRFSHLFFPPQSVSARSERVEKMPKFFQLLLQTNGQSLSKPMNLQKAKEVKLEMAAPAKYPPCAPSVCYCC